MRKRRVEKESRESGEEKEGSYENIGAIEGVGHNRYHKPQSLYQLNEP